MSWLLHNPLADLGLLYFLLLFAAAGAAGLFVGGIGIWLCDGTRDNDLPIGFPGEPDPYEVAYLQGGAVRVTQLAIFDLIEKGYLELSVRKGRFGLFPGARMLRRSSTAPDPAPLTTVQRAAWNWVSVPRLPSHILHRHTGLSKVIAPLCEGYVSALGERRLLETPGHRLACSLVRWVLSMGLGAVGFYKLGTMAIAGEGESICLILLIAVGLVGTQIICRRVRLSDLGHRYLEGLHLAFGDWDHASRMPEAPLQVGCKADGSKPERLLRMALFGTDSVRQSLDHHTEAGNHEQQVRSLVQS